MKPSVCALLLMGIALPLVVNAEPAADQKVGVMWVSESAMAERVTRGFLRRMAELAPDVELELQRALPDDAAARPVFRRFQAEKDAVLFLREHGARWLADHSPKVPSFIVTSGHPERLGVLADMNRPGGLVTGVTRHLPATRQFELYRKLFPELRSVGLLVQSGDTEAGLDIGEMRALCEELGLECSVASCATKTELVAQVKRLRGNVDLLLLGDQKLLVDNSAVVVTLAGATPVMSCSMEPPGRGVLGAPAPDDAKLGAMLAESVCAVLGGTAVAEVPVKTDLEPRLFIDPRRLAELGLELPDNLAASMEDL